GGEGTGSNDAGGAVLVDLSLAWETQEYVGCSGGSSGGGGGTARGGAALRLSTKGGVVGLGSPSATSHYDLWRAESDEEEGEGGWRWLGRAYGKKYRLAGLRIEGAAERAATKKVLLLAVQQVNAMGYREPVKDWAKLELRLP
ncbi:unnamed protein product, partial [Pylaiella littoralis]